MADADSTYVSSEDFLEILNQLPWCQQAQSKQNDAVLVAVHKCIPEVIEIIKEHEVRVFPGGITIKLNKSTLSNFQDRFDDGQPIPIVVVWRKEVVEIYFRQHKPDDFPYDAWSNPLAQTYETECAIVPKSSLGQKYSEYFEAHLKSANACPTMIPPQ